MKLAILGPKGTFSESAAIKYQSTQDLDFEKVFFNTIPHTFKAVNTDCDYGIIPIENTLDGYVQRSLDLLLELDLCIIDEITVPVKFSLISNITKPSEIKKLYVQFKAHGQCLKFIESLSDDVEIIITDSNTESLEQFSNDESNCCAIIPAHLYNENKFYGIEDVTDSKNNFTRFFIITKAQRKFIQNKEHLTGSLYVIPDTDRPGMLYEILENFSKNSINLSSIISRPTKQNLGTYNFYIEISGHISELEKIQETIKALKLQYNIKVLGLYSK